MEDEAPLCYYHNWTIYPHEVTRCGEEPITIMWSKASPLEEGLHFANHIVPVVRKYPVVYLLFKWKLEDGAPTSEHVFLYENLAEEETPEVIKDRDSEKGSDNTISNSSRVSNGTSTTVNNTKKRGRKKVTNRGSSSSTENTLPRPTKFVATPGYSVLSHGEKEKRNKELAQQNREALQAMRDQNKCKVVLTPVNVPVDYVKTVEIGNNDMSPKEELSLEQGKEATDINPQPVKDDKSTGSNSDVATMLLTEEEEEPPIISENPMEMGNNHMSPKEELSPEQGEEATDINPEAVKDEKSMGCNAEVSTTLLTGQEEESPIISENTMEMGNNHTSRKEELSLEQGEDATDINPEAVKDEKSTGSNAEVPTTLLTGQEREPPIICEKEMEIGNTNMSPKEVLSSEESKVATDINPEAVKDEKSTESNAGANHITNWTRRRIRR